MCLIELAALVFLIIVVVWVGGYLLVGMGYIVAIVGALIVGVVTVVWYAILTGAKRADEAMRRWRNDEVSP